MPFEYDAAKSRENKLKHGIDFEEAQALWSDPNATEFPARDTDEPRFGLIGLIGESLWSAIFTYCGENIRIISVRHARPVAVQQYESQRSR